MSLFSRSADPAAGNHGPPVGAKRPMLLRTTRGWRPKALLPCAALMAARRSASGGSAVAASASRQIELTSTPAEAGSPAVNAVGTEAEVEGMDVGCAVDLRQHAPTDCWLQRHCPKIPQQWLAFSDLHVSPKTLGTCLQVLELVHEEASRRGAGILFLGDFWHTRGTLPVEPLNAVVTQLASWKQPTLMLPGNHDQVSLGGEVHALTPLAAANPAIHVFNGPALFLNALWLPYRRKRGELEAALAAASAEAAAAGPGASGGALLQGVFAHTDIIGAMMNEAYQAHDGLPPSIFPPDIPTYTGHYHNPHTVAGSRITYIGSPYQVTRAEAGQQKRLLLLDRSKGWEVAEQVRLDVGPRYFAAAAVPAAPSASTPAPAAADAVTAAELEAGMVGEEAGGSSADTDAPGSAAAAAAAQEAPAEAAAAAVTAAEDGFELLLPEGLRSGDRLLLTLPPAAAKQHKKQLAKLEKQGVQVEVVAPPEAAAAPRIQAAEGLGPLQLWDHYSSWQRMPPPAAAAGAELLRSLLGGSSPAGGAGLEQPHISLQFESVEVEGYFSFREPVRYQLGERGLVVVTGLVQDTAEAGVESNGAGKTALMMAPLWALTGGVDTRSDGGSFSGARPVLADLINDGAKRARVRVEGLANGSPFVVERVANRKSSSVSFQLGGEELTTQENRLTQQRINELLGAELLGRVVFYGQSDITALLEAPDRAFKSELAKLVDLEVWSRAKEASRVQFSTRKDALRDASTTLRERQQQTAGLQQQADELAAAAQEWEVRAAETEAVLQAEAASVLRQLHAQRQGVLAAVAAGEQQVADMSVELRGLEQELQGLEQQKQALIEQQIASQGGSIGQEELAAAEQQLAAAQHCQQSVQQEQARQQYSLGGAAGVAADARRQQAAAQAAAAAAAAELQAFVAEHPALWTELQPPPAVDLERLLQRQLLQQAAVQEAERALTVAQVAAAAQQSRAAAKQEAVEAAARQAATAQAAAEHSSTVAAHAAAAAGPAALSVLEVTCQQKSLQQRLAAAQQRLGTAQGQARERQQQLDEYLQLAGTAGSTVVDRDVRNGSGWGHNGSLINSEWQASPTAAAVASTRHIHAPADGDSALCDRCLQPISRELFEGNVARLQSAAAASAGAAEDAALELQQLQALHADLDAAADRAAQQEQQAAAATAAKDVAARAASAAAAAVAEGRLAAARLAELEADVAEAVDCLQQRQVDAAQLLASIEVAQAALELEAQRQLLLLRATDADAEAAAAVQRQEAAEQRLSSESEALRLLQEAASEAAAAVEAAQRELQAAQQQGQHLLQLEQQAAVLLGKHQQLEQRQRLVQQQLAGAAQLAGSTLAGAVQSLEDLCGVNSGSSGGSGGASSPSAAGPALPEWAEGAAPTLESVAAAAHSCLAAAEDLQQRWRWHRQQPNQPARDAALVRQQLDAAAQQVADVERRQAELETELALWKQVDEAFLPRGIPNFAVEGVLGDLQAAASRNLSVLTSGMTLSLNPCKPSAAAKKQQQKRKKKGATSDEEGAEAAAGEAVGGMIEEVEKVVHVRQAGGLEMRQRNVCQLSGGERRRVALALALGFSELAAQRGRLRSNLIVLDEVMQHLDGEGCLRAAQLLKQLPYSSILVVAQAHSLLTRAFDSTDVVVKSGGHSRVEQGSSASVS